MVTLEYKTCKKCGKTFPATVEYFWCNPGNKDGLTGNCRICENERQNRTNKEYRNAHPVEAAQARKLYYHTHLKPNIRHRISRNVSSLMNWELRRNGGTKAHRHWEDLAGYTVDDLIAHLESKFQPGMTRENHGKNGWHIDHIRPISSFHYTSPEDPEFKECWALSNLQPLWAHDNWVKYNKWTPPDNKKIAD